MSPIHEDRKRDEPQNYGSMNFTSQLTKCFQILIRKQLIEYLKVDNLYNTNQSRKYFPVTGTQSTKPNARMTLKEEQVKTSL